MATVEHCLYCFEVLAAEFEKRTPMTLYQVQTSWAEYPKGLEDGEGEPALSDQEGEEAEDGTSSGASEQEAAASFSPSTKRPKLNNPAVSRLNNDNSNTGTGTSTPASSSSTSSTSLAAPSSFSSTSTSTPASSTYSPSSPSFTPIGIGHRTSQRSHPTLTDSPLFVTWNKLSPTSTSPPRLRGCIGTFEPQPLSTGLASYALTSATGDTRFSPISASELAKLEVSVTLLTDFEVCTDPTDWKVGVHGLKITFYHHHKRYGATYLPDVAVEQGWTKEETLLSLMRKAGWSGRREKWREVGDLRVVRYQGKKESVDFEEFRRWREWVDGGEKTGREES